VLQGLCALAAGYALLAAAAGPRRRAWSAALAAGAAALAFVPSGPTAHDFGVPEGAPAASDLDARVLPYVRPGLGATVAVTRDTALGIDMLWIDRGHQGDTTTPGRRLYERLGSLPGRLAERTPGRTLMIGLGTGISLGALAESGAGPVDVAELVDGVIHANRTVLADANGRVLERPGVRVLHADGRTVLADAAAPYDLIVANMVFPSVSGATSLFSREFYALSRRRLAADGVFVQWISCLQFGPDELRSVAAAFRTAFPDGTACVGVLGVERIVLGLVGGRIREGAPIALDARALERLAAGAAPVRDADPRIEHRTSRLQPDGESAAAMLGWLADALPDGSAWAQVARGSLLERDGHDDAAAGAYEEASRRLPGGTDAAFRLDALAHRRHLKDAGIAARRGDVDATLGHLRRAAGHPDFVQGDLGLAETLIWLGRPREALEELQRAGAKAPRAADIHAKIAMLAVELGEGPRARSALETALALRDDRPPLYLRLQARLGGPFRAEP
jgi:hypothetical protein